MKIPHECGKCKPDSRGVEWEGRPEKCVVVQGRVGWNLVKVGSKYPVSKGNFSPTDYIKVKTSKRGMSQRGLKYYRE